jgi:Flp pilus assembly protein CpaB
MRSRGLVVAIAVVLAVLAAAGVIVYTNSLRTSIETENTVEVVVSKQDIAANTALSPLVTAGAFDLIRVPEDALVAGAVRNIQDLTDETTAAPILANEQIPTSRLASANSLNQIGISPGNVGLGLSIGGPASVNGSISQGDHVVVYATFARGTPVTKSTLKQMLQPAQVQQLLASISGTSTSGTSPIIIMPFDFTTTLIPSVKVISIQNPPVDETSGRKSSGDTTMALDLTPEDATTLVYATGHSTLYLGLLPPTEDGKPDEVGHPGEAAVGVPLVKVTGVGK